jgi:hypothetical protein
MICHVANVCAAPSWQNAEPFRIGDRDFFALSSRHQVDSLGYRGWEMSDRRDHGTGYRFSVTLLRRHTVYLPAPVDRNRNRDAIRGIHPRRVKKFI